MGSHPLNLAVRFLLELSAMLAFGIWGWNQADGILRFLLAAGLPIVVAVLWGTFAVPDDPSRSGKAPIAIAGVLRLVLEWVIFGFAIFSLTDMNQTPLAWTFGIIVLVHYAVSYDRVLWLFKQ